MKRCQHCGQQCPDDAIYCSNCGYNVKDAPIQSEDETIYASPKDAYGQSGFGYDGSNKPQSSSQSKAPQVLGILSIVFGAMGGWAGLVLGIIGLSIDPHGPYRKLNLIGIWLFVAWVIVCIFYLILKASIG